MLKLSLIFVSCRSYKELGRVPTHETACDKYVACVVNMPLSYQALNFNGEIRDSGILHVTRSAGEVSQVGDSCKVIYILFVCDIEW